MEILALNQSEIINEKERTRFDLRTQFAELVDGSMRTEFSLQFDGHDLLGVDGWSMRSIAQNSLDDARRAAAEHPELEGEVSRREIESEEIDEAAAMAAGEGPNTMIVVSDFPRWLMGATEDIGGYNVRRKQTMMRVITRQADGSGSVKMISRTLDGSDRQALEAIYARFDKEPDEGELQGQRIRVELVPEQQENLDSELTGIYDRRMSDQYGGDWYAGRRPADYRNTYDFVCAQHDLIETCVQLQQRGELTDSVIYGVAATMQKRFEIEDISDLVRVRSVVPISREVLFHEIQMNGTRARQAGQSFSACGVTLSAEGTDSSTEGQMGQAGYGNKSTKANGECEFVSKKCPVCGDKNVKTKTTKEGKYVHVGKGCSS